MLPDINIKDYYLHFIHNAKVDIDKYTDKLDTTIQIKNKLYNYLKDKENIIASKFDIVLSNYNKEWINKEYNTSELLYNKTMKHIYLKQNEDDRIILLQICKYCKILYSEYKYNKLIELANKRKDIKFTVYRKYVTDYYNKVHKFVLEGYGYRFQYDIGTYCINYWKMDLDRMKHKTRIDFAATNARKKELLSKGVKLYDDKEAAWYKARNIPYDGVDYRIYKEENHFYEFTFIKSNIFKSSNLEYKHTEYIANKYRGMSYVDMAEKLCKTDDDIYNLQVDIKYKLNILLYKKPNTYLNFIRNAEQCKYKRGGHNC